MRLPLAAGLAATITVLGVSAPAFADGAPNTPVTTAKATTVGTPNGYPASGYVPIVPKRIADSRGGGLFSECAGPFGSLGANTYTSVEITQCASHMPPTPTWSIPSQATAVVVNVTATNATATSYFSVGPFQNNPAGVPAYSTLAFSPGHDVANLATVPVTIDGSGSPAIDVYNHLGTADVVVDVLGYYMPADQPVSMDRYTPTTPTRLLDTRDGAGTKLGWGASQTVQIRGRAGIPDTASSVVVNLTATQGTVKSFLAAYPGGAVPTTSTVNYDPGQDVANQAIVPIAPDGTISVYNHAGEVHAIVDVVGYYSPGGKSLFTPVPPSRLLDSRTTGTGPLGPNTTRALQVTGGGPGVPAGATGAVLNLTATEETGPSHLTVWPDGQSLPATSSLNYQTWTDVSNHVQTALGSDGAVDIYNHSADTHVVVDLFGYFTNA